MHTTILDTHLHLYPEYNLPRAFNQLLDRSAQLGKDVRRVACLAERHDCHYFQSLAAGETKLEGFNIKAINEVELQLSREQDKLSVILLPGRQVITKENIEVLALACPEPVVDGQPALDVIYQINQLKAVPVISWSPGKWFGKRGELVKKLITELDSSSFLIGDTTLRPYGWLTPVLIKQAVQRGFGVIAGSDPLPFAGEEQWLGAYYTIATTQSPLAATALLHSIKNTPNEVQWHNQGKRTNIINLFDRLRKNAASKKR